MQLAVVRLKPGQSGPEGEREVGVEEGTTDAAGRVRWTGLTTGDVAGFAAVTEHEGLRLGTQPFRMPTESGMRGQIVALRRAADSRVLSLDPRSKIIVDLREDAIQLMFAFLRPEYLPGDLRRRRRRPGFSPAQRGGRRPGAGRG